MRSHWNRRFVFIAILAIVVGTAAALVVTFTSTSKVNREKAFLSALLRQDENTAINYVSSDLRTQASASCPDGRVTNCVTQLISEWGELTEVHFAIGSGSRNTSLYHTFWSNLNVPVSVVVVSNEIDGIWDVVGWRGLILSEGEDLDSQLLRGTRLDNQFPEP